MSHDRTNNYYLFDWSSYNQNEQKCVCDFLVGVVNELKERFPDEYFDWIFYVNLKNAYNLNPHNKIMCEVVFELQIGLNENCPTTKRLSDFTQLDLDALRSEFLRGNISHYKYEIHAQVDYVKLFMLNRAHLSPFSLRNHLPIKWYNYYGALTICKCWRDAKRGHGKPKFNPWWLNKDCFREIAKKLNKI